MDQLAAARVPGCSWRSRGSTPPSCIPGPRACPLPASTSTSVSVSLVHPTGARWHAPGRDTACGVPWRSAPRFST
eukprot:1510249-Rhodomonas_salina.1